MDGVLGAAPGHKGGMVTTAAPASSAPSQASTVSSAPVSALKTPLERYSEAVESNPLDFNSWVQLLAIVESEQRIPRQKTEETFDRFLTEFPLCFGYWNKYAQYEYGLSKRLVPPSVDAGAEQQAPVPLVSVEEATRNARQVYERGVVAVRYSVDMWLRYCEFLINTVRVPAEEARNVLESALEACGSDPAAGPLWDMAIQLETLNNDMPRVNLLFKRILHQPLSNLEEFWEKYNQFVLAQQLSTLATTEELNALVGDKGEDEMDEGLLRIKLVNAVEAIKNKTAEGIAKRQAFEAGIDRSYFHVTPVSDAALRNWHAYLDYEEVAQDQSQDQSRGLSRCEFLYERCLIACANYEQMWVRFALWKEKTQGFDAARGVFDKATTVFLKRRGTMFLEYARFLEAHGQFDCARQLYNQVLDKVSPGLAEAFVAFANFERRRGDLDTTQSIYERAMTAFSSEPDAFGYVTVCFAEFVWRRLHDAVKARKVYEKAVGQVSSSLLLWMSFVQFEISMASSEQKNDNQAFVERVASIYHHALAESCDLSASEKNDVWFHYSEFMEHHAVDVAALRQVYRDELTWKRKNAVSREPRGLKKLMFPLSESNRSLQKATVTSTAAASSASVAHTSTAQVPVQANSSSESMESAAKRPRYDTPVVSAVSAATTSSGYGQYYQNYQAYGYSQAVDPATTTTSAPSMNQPATSAGYSQPAQAAYSAYAGYYQQ